MCIHINNSGCHIYVFLFYHDGRHRHAENLFYIWNTSLCDKIQNMNTILVIFCNYDNNYVNSYCLLYKAKYPNINIITKTNVEGWFFKLGEMWEKSEDCHISCKLLLKNITRWQPALKQFGLPYIAIMYRNIFRKYTFLYIFPQPVTSTPAQNIHKVIFSASRTIT